MSDPLVIEAKNISKTFLEAGENLSVLRGVDFALRAGESVSIRGESGSGKTTLLYILSALETPTGGELFWNGERVNERSHDWAAARRAQWMGMVFQSYHLMPELDALENVLMARRIAGGIRPENKARALALLERVGLKDRARHVPAKLSGGECQRVAVARALMNKPKVLLADEPTGNLDETTGEEVMTLLLELTRQENSALVLVTHNAAHAARADRSLFLRKGGFDETMRDDIPAV